MEKNSFHSSALLMFFFSFPLSLKVFAVSIAILFGDRFTSRFFVISSPPTTSFIHFIHPTNGWVSILPIVCRRRYRRRLMLGLVPGKNAGDHKSFLPFSLLFLP
ncbi:hypothetical protein OUZ56_009150 [Daphnia magna]|uniref:Secreted protein n=1 Tax=Daphnia magna TaxID=35525 RepID=A0ABR0AF48_9CRUS|nr:hypothetical protein OUZ56_009150 [Daphnia magna]